MQEIPISDKIPELDIAIKAAKEAGNAILEIYHDDYKTSTKDDDSPITDAILRVMNLSKEFSHRPNMQFCLKKIMMI